MTFKSISISSFSFNTSSQFAVSVSDIVQNAVLYCSVVAQPVTAKEIIENKDPLVDLASSNPLIGLSTQDNVSFLQRLSISDSDLENLLNRFKALSSFDQKYAEKSYEGNSKVRLGVFERLLKMLTRLPGHIGIAYFEGYRPLSKQKEYFDQKFIEIFHQELANTQRTLSTLNEETLDHLLEMTYNITTTHVSPFIDNIPTHSTGAAIDIHLYDTRTRQLLDIGQFDVIFGKNEEQQAFASHLSVEKQNNRVMLFQAAAESGFAIYGNEWWHLSYGDKVWAFVYKQPSAHYGYAGSNEPIVNLTKKDYLELMKIQLKASFTA